MHGAAAQWELWFCFFYFFSLLSFSLSCRFRCAGFSVEYISGPIKASEYVSLYYNGCGRVSVSVDLWFCGCIHVALPSHPMMDGMLQLCLREYGLKHDVIHPQAQQLQFTVQYLLATTKLLCCYLLTS